MLTSFQTACSPCGSTTRGSLSVSAANNSRATISGLASGTRYYVRVATRNAQGHALAALASPSSAVTAAQAPGKVSFASVAEATNGTLVVSCSPPVVPAHGVFCFGGRPKNPGPLDCPSGPGSGVVADGGSAITLYTVEWGTSPHFNETLVNNQAVTSALQVVVPAAHVELGRLYYVQVLAQNAVGFGLPQRREGALG